MNCCRVLHQLHFRMFGGGHAGHGLIGRGRGAAGATARGKENAERQGEGDDLFHVRNVCLFGLKD